LVKAVGEFFPARVAVTVTCSALNVALPKLKFTVWLALSLIVFVAV